MPIHPKYTYFIIIKQKSNSFATKMTNKSCKPKLCIILPKWWSLKLLEWFVDKLWIIKIAVFAQNYIWDFQNLVNILPTSRCSVPKKWHPLATKFLKINFDNAMFEESDEDGIGVVIRNSKGEVMAAFYEKIQTPTTIEVLELLAANWVVCFSLKIGFINFVLEGDSKFVI